MLSLLCDSGVVAFASNYYVGVAVSKRTRPRVELTYAVGECEIYKEKRDVLRDDVK